MHVDDRDQPTSHLPLGCLAGLVPAALAALYPMWQALRDFNECEIGINSSANGLYMMIFVWPVLTAVGVVAFGLTFGVIRRRTTGRYAMLAAFTALVAFAAVAPYVLILLSVPADYPTACS